LGGGVVQPDRIWLRSVRDATSSGSLLTFNPESRTMEENPLTVAAAELLREASEYASRFQWAAPYTKTVIGQIAASGPGNAVSLPVTEAVPIWALYHSQANFHTRLASLYGCLRGVKPDPGPESLLPGTPFGAGMQAKIDDERPSKEQLRDWFNLP